MFKETGHENAYFPLFVPKSLFEAEEKNAAGFAKECAIVTHYRLKNDPEKKGKLIVDPESKLEEELIVRPTSEAIIWKTYKKWIQSYRDLPILINQWANVVRWEMRTRLFLRTAEFLWQEGHTAHATKDEALKETKLINDLYSDFAENFMAMPVVKGYKSESERFAGAEETLCIEALMQDGKALQAGTSHFLGQNFAKAFDVKFADKSGKLEYVWATSWGVSTRLMGALIMSHSDDIGLVLPPLLAPIQIIIIPLIKSKDDPKKILDKTNELNESLKNKGIRVKIDNRENTSLGFKLNDSEVKGIPMRIVIGEKEIDNNEFDVFYRHNLKKVSSDFNNLHDIVSSSLTTIQTEMISNSKERLRKNTHEVNSYDKFKELISNQSGFVIAGWDGTNETEEAIKSETKATIRCIPENLDSKGVTCIYSGKPARYKVIFSKSY
jgi:prolyl-tRNA synthetase